jgi:taurine dioxygenase
VISVIALDELTPDRVSECGVVCVRLGAALSPHQFLQTVAPFGTPVPFGLRKYRPLDFPAEVTLLDSHGDGLTAAPRGFGEGWHQDSTYLRDPPAYTVLHAHHAPEAGGATLFADTRVALPLISAEERGVLETLRLEHAVRHTYRVTPEDVGRRLEEISRDLAVTHHEVIVNHPRGGTTLRLSPLYTAPYVPRAVRPLFDRLVATITERSFKHQWQVGDLVVWDNRVVLHAVEPYTGSARRCLIRTLVRDRLEMR